MGLSLLACEVALDLGRGAWVRRLGRRWGLGERESWRVPILAGCGESGGAARLGCGEPVQSPFGG